MALFWGGVAHGPADAPPGVSVRRPLLGLALARRRARLTAPTGAGPRGSPAAAAPARLAPYAGGVLLVAVPWLALNGLAYGSLHLVAHRRRLAAGLLGHLPAQPGLVATGFARAAQVRRGEPPRGAGRGDEDRPARPGLPGGRPSTGAATPLQAMATEVNKLYQALSAPLQHLRRGAPPGRPAGRTPASGAGPARPGRRRAVLAPAARLALLLGAALVAFGCRSSPRTSTCATPSPRPRWAPSTPGWPGRRCGARSAGALPVRCWRSRGAALRRLGARAGLADRRAGLAPWRAHLLQRC